MRKKIWVLLALLVSLSVSANSDLENFILSFNDMNSSCDKMVFEKAYSDGGAVIKMTLHDLEELGNPEFSAGVSLKDFEFENKFTAVAKRFSRYDGKKVKEVFTFQKDNTGKFKSVSLKRFKRSFFTFSYPLGGINCRLIVPSVE